MNDLKLTGVTAVAHKYIKWTKGMGLNPDDVELRSAQWEELLPKGLGNLDVDAVSQRYFKMVRGKRRFEAGGKVLELILAISHELYEIAHTNSIRDDSVPLQVCKRTEECLVD